MKKIPTLFVRDPEDRAHVLDEVNPQCQWVLDGEGVATRKIDGTCMKLDNRGQWWARREIKQGKPVPGDFIPEQHDPVTGKTVGWAPAEDSSFAKFWLQALQEFGDSADSFTPGTYELIGPKINGNPERVPYHTLVSHADTQRIKPFSLTFEGIRDTCLLVLAPEGIEGIVWHHPDGRMAKIKVRDFALVNA